jgi:hypothetical protein
MNKRKEEGVNISLYGMFIQTIIHESELQEKSEKVFFMRRVTQQLG